MADKETRRATEVARLNDHLRRTFPGDKVVITRGITALVSRLRSFRSTILASSIKTRPPKFCFDHLPEPGFLD